MTKHCNKCETHKSTSEFNKNRRNKDGLSDWCKSCNKLYREENNVAIKEYRDTYKKNNSEYFKDYSKKYHKRRLKEDPKYKLAHGLRIRVSDALFAKRWNKSNSLKNYLGCSLDYLISYIESMFQSGMNWQNHGKWHIDHIIPLSSAKSVDELYLLCHYKNLQPLWELDNLKKGRK